MRLKNPFKVKKRFLDFFAIFKENTQNSMQQIIIFGCKKEILGLNQQKIWSPHKQIFSNYI